MIEFIMLGDGTVVGSDRPNTKAINRRPSWLHNPSRPGSVRRSSINWIMSPLTSIDPSRYASLDRQFVEGS